MTPERYQKILQTLRRRQPDLTLLTEQIHKPRNIAALVRTSDAVGIQEVNMVWPWDEHRPYSGTAMGSDRWVDIRRHTSMEEGMAALKSKGYALYAAHVGDQVVDYREVDFCRPCALVLGNEKKGLSPLALESVDVCLKIPMEGMVESYNVSVAAAIILSEAHHQRKKAGFYAQQRLDPETFRDTFFRWAHPKIARFCDERGLEYPPVREDDGELVNPSAWYESVRGDTPAS